MKSKKSFFRNLSGLQKTLLAILGIMAICLSCFSIMLVMQVFLSNIGESIQSVYPTPTHIVNPAPTQRVKPNYSQLLESNGYIFVYADEEGTQYYISDCLLLVGVKPNSVGFVVNADKDTVECQSQDLGNILAVMYPSGVLDFVVANIEPAMWEDKLIRGQVDGYKISMDFDPAEYMLAVIVLEPR